MQWRCQWIDREGEGEYETEIKSQRQRGLDIEGQRESTHKERDRKKTNNYLSFSRHDLVAGIPGVAGGGGEGGGTRGVGGVTLRQAGTTGGKLIRSYSREGQYTNANTNTTKVSDPTEPKVIRKFFSNHNKNFR